jgi:hypothetical protein
MAKVVIARRFYKTRRGHARRFFGGEDTDMEQRKKRGRKLATLHIAKRD